MGAYAQTIGPVKGRCDDFDFDWYLVIIYYKWGLAPILTSINNGSYY